jgi:hypothetical protein
MYQTILAREAVNHVDLSSGLRVGLPAQYLDWTGVMAHFPASSAAIRRLLPSRKLALAQIAPGTAILSLAAIEYRRLADIAPYKEVAIMTPVLYKPLVNLPALPLFFPGLFGSFGFFVLHMPVTTPDARELGAKVWGCPKFLADISFEETENIRRCRVCADGEDLLTFEVEQVPAKIRRVDFRIYTAKDGRLLRNKIETEGLYGLSPFPGGAAASFGDHPIGRQLKALGVGRRPIARVFGSNVASLLHEASDSFPL